MKKILVTTLVATALAVSAFAQGTVTFSAAKGTLTYSMDNGATKTPIPTTGLINGSPLNLALYAAPKGTALNVVNGVPDLTGWTIASPVLKSIGPFAGTMANQVVTIPASLSGAEGGNTVQLEVVAWTGASATFDPTASFVGFSGSTLSGGAPGWNQATGTVNPPSTVFVTTGAGGFNGLVLAPIPEPSTFALAGLGAAALLIFRRRK